jgi:enoyl-CoA hydratase/carnithine racemase
VTKLADYADKYANLRCERRDNVLLMRLHTDGGPFVFSDGAHHELGFAFYDIAADPENKVLILTGTGEDFCTRFDYASFESQMGDSAHEWALRQRADGRRMLAAFLDIEVPVIAAVNGPALSHSELALLSDVVLVDDTTFFQDATHFLQGIAPGDGMHMVWTTLLGPNRGRYFLLTGQKLGAQDALALGVVGEVLPRDRLMERAWELALQWSTKSKAVLTATRHVLNYEWKQRLLQQLHHGLTEEMGALISAALPTRPAQADLLAGD